MCRETLLRPAAIAASFFVLFACAAVARAQGVHAHHGAASPAITVDIDADPSPPEAGSEARITVTLRDSDGNPPQGLEVGHERLAHFLFVSRDLEEFHHLHAEDFGATAAELTKTGVYPLRAIFSRGGPWLLGVDLLVSGGAVVLATPFKVSGSAQGGTAWDFDGKRKAGGLDFRLTTAGEPKAGARTEFTLEILEGGAPAMLSPYLGAAAHVAAFSEGAASLAHLHGTSAAQGAPSSGGHGAHGGHGGHGEISAAPPLAFGHLFAEPGNYRLWVQVQKASGEVVTLPFDVKVGL